MICLQSSPSLLQVLLSVNAGPGQFSIEKRGCLRKKKKHLKSSFTVEYNQSVMLKQPRSHSVMECCSLLFSCTHFPSTCLAYFYFCSPHSPKLLRPPPEKSRELAPFNQMRERGCMNSIKVLSFSCGEAAPFPQNPKLTWSCNAFWSIFCYCGCKNSFSLWWTSLCTAVEHQSKLSLIKTWLNTDDVFNHWMIWNSTEAVRNIWIWCYVVVWSVTHINNKDTSSKTAGYNHNELF